MSLILALLVLAAQEPAVIELEGSVRSDPYDFEIGLPKGWEAKRTTGSTFFRVEAPAAVLADGAAWLAHHDSNHPVTLLFLTENFLKRAETDYPGFRSVSERDVRAAGLPARQIIFTATARGEKELVFVHTLIQRQLQEYLVLDVVAASREKERVLALSDKMLAAFRIGLPALKEREDRIARTSVLLKTAPVRPGLAGTYWHELIIADKKFGWQKTMLREAKIDGSPGWEFELEVRQEDAEGGKRSDISKGSFTADGSIQRVDFTRSVRTPKDPPVDCRESASLVRGTYKAERQFLDQKVEKEFKAAEGTFLGDVAETMRRVVALSPAGKNALRVIEPFRDLPTYEEWEHARPSRIRVDGQDRELIQALVTYPRQESFEYLFDLDGSLVRRRGTRGIMVLKRCTEEEALKR